ncbi:MAG: hydrogenase maturation nickel metallochaperone HypA [Phycisphaerae bacterium]
MHELAIAQALVDLASAEAVRSHAVPVARVSCRVGVLRQIDPTALRYAFELARGGTACATAELHVEPAPLRAYCRACGREFVVEHWEWRCPECGGDGAALSGGDELDLVSIESEARP